MRKTISINKINKTSINNIIRKANEGDVVTIPKQELDEGSYEDVSLFLKTIQNKKLSLQYTFEGEVPAKHGLWSLEEEVKTKDGGSVSLYSLSVDAEILPLNSKEIVNIKLNNKDVARNNAHLLIPGDRAKGKYIYTITMKDGNIYKAILEWYGN